MFRRTNISILSTLLSLCLWLVPPASTASRSRQVSHRQKIAAQLLLPVHRLQARGWQRVTDGLAQLHNLAVTTRSSHFASATLNLHHRGMLRVSLSQVAAEAAFATSRGDFETSNDKRKEKSRLKTTFRGMRGSSQGPLLSPANLAQLREAETVAVLGDSGTDPLRDDAGTRRDTMDRIAATIDALDVDAVVLLGDNSYPKGGPERYGDTIGRYYSKLLNRGKPIVAILGNEDGKSKYGAHQARYLGISEGPYRVPLGQSTELFALDAQAFVPGWDDIGRIDVRAAMAKARRHARRLDRMLSKSTAPHKILAIHYPFYTTGKYQALAREVRQLLEPIVIKHNVDLVMSGHDHFGAVSEVGGTTHLLVGSSGKASHPKMTFTDPAHPVAFHTTDHVFALLREDVPGERLETELWTADGPVRAPHRSFTSDERQRLEAEQATLGRFHEALVRNPRLIDLARRINPHTPRRGRAVRWGADLYYTGLVTADMAWRDDGDGQKTRVIRVFIDRYEIKADPQLLRQRDKIEELRDNVMSELRDALPARFGDYEVEVLEGPNDEEFAAWKESLRQ